MCMGTTGTMFSDVELLDGEWNDYDEKVVSSAFSSHSLLNYFSLRPSYL